MPSTSRTPRPQTTTATKAAANKAATSTAATARPSEYFTQVASPIGRLEIVSNGVAITGLSIEASGRLPRDGIAAQRETQGVSVADAVPVLAEAERQLEEYFDGRRKIFDLPLRLVGTRFQQEIWTELESLAWGNVTTYGNLGRASGRVSAGRAVGGAVGANPIPIIVPCHRVLASNGRITGYSGGDGIPTKVWLLEHEQIAYRE